jgi:hypothetical protein
MDVTRDHAESLIKHYLERLSDKDLSLILDIVAEATFDRLSNFCIVHEDGTDTRYYIMEHEEYGEV